MDYFYQDNTRSGSHSRYNLKYHFVWITKYRREILTGTLPERLKQILAEISSEYGFYIIAQEIMPDHVHMLVETPPKLAPATVVRILKSISARKMLEEFPSHIRKYIWRDRVLWATGYYVATVADRVTTEIVQEYIETQKTRKP
ncbi:IS200/IS605 family transposase [Candidatus Acetothermia bacterium]|nr:IS200/IS605 family transposase [Candidatus Acetothermia bacterium]